MSTTVDQLIVTVVMLLTTPVKVSGRSTYPTLAGARVYAPRDWPTKDDVYPAIFVSAPSGEKESLGRNQPLYTTTETIRLLSRVDAPAASSDGNAGPVQATLLAMKRQIEVTLIGAPALMSQIQQIARVRSELGFNSGGEKHLGELGIEMDMEFVEDAWSFCTPPDNPLTEATVATNATDLGSGPAAAHVAPGLDLTIPQ